MRRVAKQLSIVVAGGLLMAATPWLDRWTFADVSHRFGDGRLMVTFTVDGDGPHLPTACVRLVDARGTAIYRGQLARLEAGDPGHPLSRAVPVEAAVWSQAARMVLSLTAGNCETDAGAEGTVAFFDVR
jgi:hypothetical protein